MIKKCGHLFESVVNMSDEFMVVRAAEFEAWECCAQQYQFAYAFIRVHNAGKEREWINSFGDLVLERLTESKALFVFFSDLELSIVTKILDQNVRLLNRDKAALEVLVGAWFQSSDEYISHANQVIENKTSETMDAPAQGQATQDGLFEPANIDEAFAYEDFYRQGVERLSMTLMQAALDLESFELREKVLEHIRELLNCAAQQGYSRLYLYLQNMESTTQHFLEKYLSFDRYFLEALRDCVGHVRGLVGAIFSEDQTAVAGSELMRRLRSFPSEMSDEKFDFKTESHILLQQSLLERLLNTTGNLRVDALEFKRLEEDLLTQGAVSSTMRKLSTATGRFVRHVDTLQCSLEELTTVTFEQLLNDSAQSAVFRRASHLLPLCCEVEGRDVRIHHAAVNSLRLCLDFLHKFLDEFDESFNLMTLCNEPLMVSIRRSPLELAVSIGCAPESKHWHRLVQDLAYQFGQNSENVRVVNDAHTQVGVTLKFPVAAPTAQNLLVVSAGEHVALSARSLVETGRVERHRIQNVGSKRFVPFRDGVIPLVSLNKVIGFEPKKKSNAITQTHSSNIDPRKIEPLEYVIAKVSDECVAFEVDAVLGHQEMVVRKLNRLLPKLNGLLGACVLEDERISLAVDVAQLFASMEMTRGEYARKAS